MSAQVTLSLIVYDLESLSDAVRAYRDICSVRVVERAAKATKIDIESLPGVADEGRATREFLNYLLDASLERHLRQT